FSSSLYSLILPYISLTPFLPFLPFLSLHFFLPPALSSCSLTLFLLRRPLLSPPVISSCLLLVFTGGPVALLSLSLRCQIPEHPDTHTHAHTHTHTHTHTQTHTHTHTHTHTERERDT